MMGQKKLKFHAESLMMVDKFGVLDNVKTAIVLLIRKADRKSTRLNSSHFTQSRMPSSA